MKAEFQSFPRSARLYLISQFLLAGYYTWPFWYGFASERISASQFGVYLATFYIVGLVSEIPAGAFADSYGRKRSAIIGALCGVVMPLIVYFGGGFSAYLAAAAIAGMGGAFISGSLESLVHDLPGMSKEVYRRVMVHDTFFYQTGLIVATALGGFMYTTKSIIPFVAQAISFLLAAIIIMQVSSDGENIKEATQQHQVSYGKRLKLYIKTNKEGFLHLFAVRDIRPLIVFGTTISVLMWMCIEYINEAAMIKYSIEPEARGLVLAGAKVAALLVLHTIVLKKVKTDKQKLTYLLIMTIAIFGLYSVGVKDLFLIAFLGFNLISSVNSNFIRPMLHDHIENKWRATAISTYSFIGNFVQAIVALAIGVMLQTQGVVFVQRALLFLFIAVGVPAFIRYIPRIKEPATID